MTGKWFMLGIHLGVPYDKLQEFKREDFPLAAVINFCLKGNINPPLTWLSIVEALKSQDIGEAELGRKLGLKYCPEEEMMEEAENPRLVQERQARAARATPEGRLKESDFSWISDKLKPLAYKWKEIALGLRFTFNEISTIESMSRLFNGAPNSYLCEMLAQWLRWAPEDTRGSTDFPTLQSLRRAVDSAGFGRVAREL